jgi:hypothetical protein
MTLRRGQHPDELISAAVRGDLTEDEQARLDAHLASCEQCRQTMAAWTEQHRLVSNLRQAPVPRDLGPRIRAGIESGAFAVPWWRRTGLLVGVGATLATVTAAVVAFVVIGDLLPGPPIASSGSPGVSASTLPSVAASASVVETAAPSPTEPPIAGEATPPYYLAFTGTVQSPALTLRDGGQGTVARELPAATGQPISAALSPDGRWLAYITPVGLKGTNMYWVVNVEDGSSLRLGESAAIGNPFMNGLFWSSNGRYLTFTLGDPEDVPKTDAWLFDAADATVSQLTARGDVLAAGWRSTQSGESRAWATIATVDPTSYELPDLAASSLPLDPTDSTTAVRGAFQPLWNWDGSAAIFWRGTLDPSSEAGYEFAEGGTPCLARDAGPDPSESFDGAEPLFSDLAIGREAFTSAAITWSTLSIDAYAVWDAKWAGVPQSSDGSPYPDEHRIYFSHLSDERNILAGHALDVGDIPEGAYVSSVAIAPLDTDYLAISIGFPAGGDLAIPEGEVLLIKRNTGDVADELIRTLKGTEQGWYGPAVYP